MTFYQHQSLIYKSQKQFLVVIFFQQEWSKLLLTTPMVIADLFNYRK